MEEIIESWNRILVLKEITDVSDKEPEVKETPVQRLCWHCAHPWVGDSIPYPFSYDERTGKFKVAGQFCSWECVKGYSRDTISRVVTGIHQMNIRHYRKKLTGLTDTVIPAPPKMTLKAFGGHLAIEEFRSQNTEQHIINYDNTIKMVAYDILDYKEVDKNVQKSNIEVPLTIPSTGIKNEHLRLRRNKPLSGGKTNIERSLGLNTFANLIKTK
jgi:hypothetical protein